MNDRLDFSTLDHVSNRALWAARWQGQRFASTALMHGDDQHHQSASRVVNELDLQLEHRWSIVCPLPTITSAGVTMPATAEIWARFLGAP